MKRKDQITALMLALDSDEDTATNALLELQAQGATIYKQKISRTPRRPVSSPPMTADLRAAIRAAHTALPDLNQQQIAQLFKVNIGRVSEALR